MLSLMKKSSKAADYQQSSVPESGFKSTAGLTSTYHVWIFRLSILIGILVLVALVFIKFPANLILFVVSLLLFLSISFWYHIQVKRRARESRSDAADSRGFPRDHSSFVDVPLEQFNDANGQLKRQQFIA